MKHKKPMLEIIYANEEDLLGQVKALLEEGADPNECTEYFETPLRVASNNGRFDVVQCLFQAGADPSHLEWTNLFHAIAYGSLAEVKNAVDLGADLHARDTWERTPVLLAVQSGDIEKVSYLIEVGADISDLGRCGKSALEYAIQMDDARMCALLIGRGFDFEYYNEFGYTPLMQAAEEGAAKCVRYLLEHGANIHSRDRSQFSQRTAIAHASTVEVAVILAEAGDDLNQMDSEVRANILGLGNQEELSVTKQEYLAQKHCVFGQSNPQICNIPFYYSMTRCNGSAWLARSQFDDIESIYDKPIWCYDRFGKSITAMENGDYIEIAGEHEDSYDPDFCIFNDVFHHKGSGDFTIYQYPTDIFPPTDFHTATLVGKVIYIIGNLGYHDNRIYGVTPVFRLNTENFKIEKVETGGDSPGWIHNHTAELMGESIIRIQRGEVVEKWNGKEEFRFNNFDFELDLKSLVWTKHEHIPNSGIETFFPGEYKLFSHSEESIIAIEENNKWRLLKIISVYRIDVTKGQDVTFEDEVVTALCDDFLFVVAYSTSIPFDSYESLEKMITDNNWILENSCKVCRTIKFPNSPSFLGFGDLRQEELDSFKAWIDAYEQGKVKIH